MTRVAELHDVTIASYPAYPAASVELRTRPERKEGMEEVAALEREPEEEEGRTDEVRTSSGGLRVADADVGQPETRTLLGQFRHAGWKPGTRSEIAWADYEHAAEQRALTWTGVCVCCGSTDQLEVHHRVPLAHGGTNELANLELGCRRCHEEAHCGR